MHLPQDDSKKKQACLAYASHLKQRSCQRDICFTVRVSGSSPKKNVGVSDGFRMLWECLAAQRDGAKVLTDTCGRYAVISDFPKSCVINLWLCFWLYLYSIYKLTYILCSYILGISGYHMFWYCDLLRFSGLIVNHQSFWNLQSWNTTWPAGARVGRPTGFRGIQEPATTFSRSRQSMGETSGGTWREK